MSAIRSGSSRPRRSEKRPRRGATTISIAAETMKAAAIAAALQPASPRSSGTSTEMTPKRTAGRTINHSAPRMTGSLIARRYARAGCGSAGVEGVRSAQPTSTTEIPAMAAKTGRVPTASATAPTPGRGALRRWPRPSRSRSSLRGVSRGVPATSHERPPVQESALPTPCAKRARPSAARGVGEAEGDARDGHENEPSEHGATGAEVGGREPSRQRRDESTRRVRPDEEPGLALREPELVRVVRQKRREGRVEDVSASTIAQTRSRRRRTPRC